MASLKKRGGVYYAQFYDPETRKQRRKSLRTGVLGLAKRRLVEVEEGLAARITDVGPTRSSLAEILAAYLHHA